jgi:protein O-mannosyl-transferase
MKKKSSTNASFFKRASSFFREEKQSFIACLLLIVATVAIYSGVTKNDFLYYDDSDYVTMNDHVQNGLTWQSVKWAFSSTDATNWHPLTWLSHIIDVQLFSLKPAAHHLMNVVYHCVAIVLLFVFLRLFPIKIWVSAFIAALFALHPLHVESVAWVAERKDVLCAVFWFGTMTAYIWYTRHPTIKKYLLFFLLFVLGLLAKPMAVTIPVILLLLDYWPLERAKEKSVIWGKLFIEKIPLFLMALASSIITLAAQKPAIGNLVNYTLASRIANATVSYLAYIQQAILPVNLSAFYPYGYYKLLSVKVISCAVILIVMSIFVLVYRKKYKYLLVGWFWYLISLIPVIGFVQVGNQAHADRYTYIPLVGIFLLIGLFLNSIMEKNKGTRKICEILAILVLCALSIKTMAQIGLWRNDVSLFGNAAAVTKNNYVAYNNLGFIYEKNGQTNIAASQYEKAIQINPKFDESHFGLGNLLLQAGQLDEAIYHYQKAIEINPNRIDFISNLAGAYFQKQQIGAAMDLMQRALFIAKAQGNANKVNECLDKINILSQAIRDSANKIDNK